jgi:hypothetical protein
MAKPLVCLKQKFYRGDKGAKYPDLKAVDPKLRDNMKPDVFVQQWSDWKYNKVANLGTGEDHGERVVVVPEDFANAVVALYPDDHEIINEATLTTFWDTKYAAYQDATITDSKQLVDLKTQRDLLVDLKQSTTDIDAKILNALDPENPEPGIKDNIEKTWAKFKEARHIHLKE